jgi:hypothetical protein
VGFAYTGYSRARGKTERDRTRKKGRTHSNRDGLKWGENNVRSEQTKEKDEDVHNSEIHPCTQSDCGSEIQQRKSGGGVFQCG